MISSDNTIKEEGLGDIFKNLGKKGPKKLAKNVLKIPEGASAIGANVDSAIASRSLEAASSILFDVENFYQAARG